MRIMRYFGGSCCAKYLLNPKAIALLSTRTPFFRPAKDYRSFADSSPFLPWRTGYFFLKNGGVSQKTTNRSAHFEAERSFLSTVNIFFWSDRG
jgi:hypothetical protein